MHYDQLRHYPIKIILTEVSLEDDQVAVMQAIGLQCFSEILTSNIDLYNHRPFIWLYAINKLPIF